jgi:hypothetical protein
MRVRQRKKQENFSSDQAAFLPKKSKITTTKCFEKLKAIKREEERKELR